MEKGMSSGEGLPSRSAQISAVKVTAKDLEVKQPHADQRGGFVLVHAGKCFLCEFGHYESDVDVFCFVLFFSLPWAEANWHRAETQEWPSGMGGPLLDEGLVRAAPPVPASLSSLMFFSPYDSCVYTRNS